MYAIYQECIDRVLWLRPIGDCSETVRLEADYDACDDVVLDLSLSTGIEPLAEGVTVEALNRKKKMHLLLSGQPGIRIQSREGLNLLQSADFYQCFDFIMEQRITVSGGSGNYLEWRRNYGFLEFSSDFYYFVHGDLAVFFINKELNSSNAGEFVLCVQKLKAEKLIINFRFLDFIDSRGMGTLIYLFRQYGAKMTICRIPSIVESLFNKVRFNEYLKLHPTQGQSLRYFMESGFLVGQGLCPEVKMSGPDMRVTFGKDVGASEFDRIIEVTEKGGFKRLILDFASTGFLTSRSLGGISRLSRLLGNRLTIVNAGPVLAKIFRTVGFDEIITVLPAGKEAESTGLFLLLKKEDGHYLHVYPEKGKPDPEAIIAYLHRRGIISVNAEVVRRVAGLGRRIEVKIEEAAMLLDAVSVMVDYHAMKAWITIDKSKTPPVPPVADLYYALIKKGVVSGIDMNTLQGLSEGKDLPEAPVLVAEGMESREEAGARIELIVEPFRPTSPQTKKNGSVDHRELNRFVTVKKGELLARRIPGTGGAPGFNVRGTVLPPPPLMPAGENTYQSPDGTELYASCQGTVFVEDGLVHVRTVLEICGDVNYETGNIRYPDHILISGGVKNGFVVEGRSISIQGMLEGGSVHSTE
ncbi:MAG: FapA family protein, partial [Candidatus Wallbacteria bacterium]|nr:FapA family protein [Candidatus Wallbacteria bacterium]